MSMHDRTPPEIDLVENQWRRAPGDIPKAREPIFAPGGLRVLFARALYIFVMVAIGLTANMLFRVIFQN